MKTEQQNCCCFCASLSEGTVVDSDILDLLKFLTVNVNLTAFENPTVCDSCLDTMLESCNYKTRNSSQMLLETKKEIDSEEPIMCQKCEKVCEPGDTFSLVNCVTQIDWLDFVNYLFANPDLKSLENSQICDSCQISLSNIQYFLKLLYKYDQSKMKREYDNCDDIKTTGNEHSVEDTVEIKQEFENYTGDNKTEIENIIKEYKIEDDEKKIEANKTEIIHVDCNGHISYSDFKCKNEEVDLKLENVDNGDDRTTNRCKKVDLKGIASSCKEEEEHFKCQQCTYKTFKKKYLKGHMKKHNNRGFKCTLCSKELINRRILENHLLKIHNCRDTVTNKIYECNKCSYRTIKKEEIMQHNIKHGIKDDSRIFKCQQCTYETYNRSNFYVHMKIVHDNIRDFKCTLCSKEFTNKRILDSHLLKIHNRRDIASEIFECIKCSYATINKKQLMEHNIKHGIKDDSCIFKCQQCTYETYNNKNFNVHMKKHNSRDFKCTLCSIEFPDVHNLDNHLLKIHNCRDVASKVYDCDKCNYATTVEVQMLQHNVKHGIKDISIFKCQHCTYETFKKKYLKVHMKKHNRDFKCSLCSKEFTQRIHLDGHLLHIHNCRDNVTSKIFDCDKCSYATIIKKQLLQHRLKHGIKDNSLIFKCQKCTYETYNQSHFYFHVKKHNNIRDFKCTLCSKELTDKQNLDNHLLIFHNSRDNITSKVYDCDKCSYATTRKTLLLQHGKKHKINDNLNMFKCEQCTYETCDKTLFHMHNKIQHFQCTLCPEKFARKSVLANHLLKVHKCKDNVTGKVYECDKCSYATPRKKQLMQHNIKHGIKDDSQIFKCQHCTYETYDKRNFVRHLKIHN